MSWHLVLHRHLWCIRWIPLLGLLSSSGVSLRLQQPVSIATPLVGDKAAAAVRDKAVEETSAAVGAELPRSINVKVENSSFSGSSKSSTTTGSAGVAVLGSSRAPPSLGSYTPAQHGQNAAATYGSSTGATTSPLSDSPSKWIPLPPDIALKYPPTAENVLDDRLQMPERGEQDSELHPGSVARWTSASSKLPMSTTLSTGVDDLEYNRDRLEKAMEGVPLPAEFSPPGTRTTTGAGGEDVFSSSAEGEQLPETTGAGGEDVFSSSAEGEQLGEVVKIGPTSERDIVENAIRGRVFEPKTQVVPLATPAKATPVVTIDEDPLAKYGTPPKFDKLPWTESDLTPLPSVTISAADAYPLLDEADPTLAATKAANDKRVWDDLTKRSRELTRGLATGSAVTEDELVAASEEGSEEGEGGGTESSTTSSTESSTSSTTGFLNVTNTTWDEQGLGKWVDNFAQKAVEVTAAAVRPAIEQRIQSVVDAEIAKAFPPATTSAGSVGSLNTVGILGSSTSSGRQSTFSGSKGEVVSSPRGSGGSAAGSSGSSSGSTFSSSSESTFSTSGTTGVPSPNRSPPVVPNSSPVAPCTVVNEGPIIVAKETETALTTPAPVDIMSYKDLYPLSVETGGVGSSGSTSAVAAGAVGSGAAGILGSAAGTAGGA
ncbi:unnamed protein product [Amoebophrya sp. A25]|nr:unnamed protein product [Amoebophrya sp. A25]|eukprot:GSA25T00016452001.1